MRGEFFGEEQGLGHEQNQDGSHAIIVIAFPHFCCEENGQSFGMPLVRMGCHAIGIC
jgi:hypothetical protein